MRFSFWRLVVMVFWMSVSSCLVFGLFLVFKIPEEVSGPMLFLGIGISISSVMNYYK